MEIAGFFATNASNIVIIPAGGKTKNADNHTYTWKWKMKEDKFDVISLNDTKQTNHYMKLLFLPWRAWKMEQISKTDWSFITQNKSMATTQRMLNKTAIPTKTVEALKAGLRIDEKFTRLPMHRMSGPENKSFWPNLAPLDDLECERWVKIRDSDCSKICLDYLIIIQYSQG